MILKCESLSCESVVCKFVSREPNNFQVTYGKSTNLRVVGYETTSQFFSMFFNCFSVINLRVASNVNLFLHILGPQMIK